MQKFSIVIPILNESENISLLTKKIYKIVRPEQFELIFVDDNSIDNTNLILIKLKSEYNNFNYIIRKSKKKDLSQSIIEGVNASNYETIIIMDGDLQHNPIYLKQIIDEFNKNKPDIIACCRKIYFSKGLILYRKILSLFTNFLIKFFLGHKLSDPLTGYFCFKKKIFLKNKHKMYCKGFKFLFDLIYSSENCKISEIEIDFEKRINHKSKLNFKIYMYFIIDLLYKVRKTYFKI